MVDGTSYVPWTQCFLAYWFFCFVLFFKSLLQPYGVSSAATKIIELTLGPGCWGPILALALRPLPESASQSHLFVLGPYFSWAACRLRRAQVAVPRQPADGCGRDPAAGGTPAGGPCLPVRSWLESSCCLDRPFSLLCCLLGILPSQKQWWGASEPLHFQQQMTRERIEDLNMKDTPYSRWENSVLSIPRWIYRFSAVSGKITI